MNLLAESPPAAILPGATSEHLVVFALSALLAAVLCAVVKPLAIKVDLVSRPRADRWARTVIPMGGGVAIMASIAAGLLALALKTPPDPQVAGSWLGDRRFDLVIALFPVFVLGLIDDKYRLSPPVKLVVQTAAACFLALRGNTLPIGPELIRAPITVGWFVFMTNSVNLLDNMDGSASGVSAVAAAFVYAIAASSGDQDLAARAAVVAGAALGFLVHNFPPASIFMGDAGSLVLGFALAGLSVKLPSGEGPRKIASVAAPALILALPIFDTALVWVARRAAGRPFFLGGRDHTTHRLVALGLSERQTLLVLWSAAALLGGAAIAVSRGGVGTAVLVGLGAACALLLCGVFLSDVRVYKMEPGKAPPSPLALSGPNAVFYAVELSVDVLVFSAAWVAAYVFKFSDATPQQFEHYITTSCVRALPFVIGLKVLALLSQGLYRGVWRSIRFDDLFQIAKACALGTVLVVATAAVADQLKDYSREVFVLDLVFTMGGVFVSRSALRGLRRVIARLAEARPAVLLGPRSLVPLVEQALGAEGRPLYRLVGVLDPDVPPQEGAPALVPPSLVGSLDDLAPAVEAAGANVALLGIAQASPERRAQITRGLVSRGIEVVVVGVKLE